MRIRALVVGLVIVGAGIAVTGRALSDDKGGKPAFSEEEMIKMAQEWMALAKPGEHHKQLNQFVGKWNTITKMWWGGPGTPAIETYGTAEIKWVLNGRFIMQESKGEMIMPSATGEMTKSPYNGMGFIGYDNYRNVFVGSWMDDVGTTMYTYKGTADPSGKVFNYYGEMDEPGLKMTGRMVHYRTTIINNDKHVFEVFDLAVGTDFKAFEITYTRQ